MTRLKAAEYEFLFSHICFQQSDPAGSHAGWKMEGCLERVLRRKQLGQGGGLGMCFRNAVCNINLLVLFGMCQVRTEQVIYCRDEGGTYMVASIAFSSRHSQAPVQGS